ncbi:hypothetical protein F5Y16DRAFT_101258 [Xylariaceae sp. FL0255]|nr:hypothetical protein F5Y16DRAFT_101258 [Xylariaceae sp. FL0255]
MSSETVIPISTWWSLTTVTIWPMPSTVLPSSTLSLSTPTPIATSTAPNTSTSETPSPIPTPTSPSSTSSAVTSSRSKTTLSTTVIPTSSTVFSTSTLSSSPSLSPIGIGASTSTSSQLASPTPSTTTTSTAPPPSPAWPSSQQGPDTAQVTLIVAVVISLFSFLVILAILFRLLMIRRRQAIAEERQSRQMGTEVAQAFPDGSGPGTMVVMPGDADDGNNGMNHHHLPEVRIVIHRRLPHYSSGQTWANRVWPMPPGHSAQYAYSSRSGTTEEGGGGGSGTGTDPVQWSMASQDGSRDATTGTQPETQSSGSWRNVWGLPSDDKKSWSN